MLRVLALLLALLPTSASALEIRTGGLVAIRETDHVADDLLAIAGTVSILGRVDGDVYALGQLVATGGQIAGDVVAAGQELRIGGRIGGDVRALGDAVQVFGPVERNVLAAGRRLQLGGRVGGSWTGWAEEAFVSGSVGRALWLTAGAVRIDGAVGGPARVMADRVTLGPAARLPGGLEYWSPADATVAAGAQAPGMARHEPRPSREVARVRELAAGAGRLLTLGLLGGSLVAALGLGLGTPRAASAAAAVIATRPLRTLAIGLGAVVLPPPVALVLGVTVLGLPLAVALLAVWGVALGLGWVLAAAALGVALGQRRAALAGVGGAALLWLVGQLPIVGIVVSVGAAVVGVGALLTLVRRASRLAP